MELGEIDDIEYFCKKLLRAKDQWKKEREIARLAHLTQDCVIYGRSNDEKLKKTHIVHIRVDENEYNLLEGKASVYGFKGISDYLRYVGLNSIVEVKTKDKEEELDD